MNEINGVPTQPGLYLATHDAGGFEGIGVERRQEGNQLFAHTTGGFSFSLDNEEMTKGWTFYGPIPPPAVSSEPSKAWREVCQSCWFLYDTEGETVLAEVLPHNGQYEWTKTRDKTVRGLATSERDAQLAAEAAIRQECYARLAVVGGVCAPTACERQLEARVKELEAKLEYPLVIMQPSRMMMHEIKEVTP